MVLDAGEIREVTSGGLQHLGMWLGFVGSAVAGYVALGMILLLVKTFGVADAEMVKTFGKVRRFVNLPQSN